jgi:hypothetical protein
MMVTLTILSMKFIIYLAMMVILDDFVTEIFFSYRILMVTWMENWSLYGINIIIVSYMEWI